MAAPKTVKVVDASNPNNVLDTETLSAFSGGVYLVWNITGNVNIIITPSSGNAVISGVFFGSANSNPTPVLGITKTHTGNFTQGQQSAAYTLTVSNSGNAPTSGTRSPSLRPFLQASLSSLWPAWVGPAHRTAIRVRAAMHSMQDLKLPAHCSHSECRRERDFTLELIK